MWKQMSKWQRILLIVLIGLLALAYVESIFFIRLEHYGPGEYQANGQTYKEHQSFLERITIDTIAFAWNWLDHNDRPILGIFTILLAVFTAALAFYTGNLWGATKVSSEKQLRAYVGVKNAFMRARSNATTSLKGLGKIVICNAGQTTATKARVALHIEVRDTLDGPFPINYRAGTTYLQPGFDWEVEQETDFDLVGRLYSDLMQKKKWLVMWGAVSYEDAFGEPRVSTFRFQQGMYVFAGTSEGWNVYPCEQGNDAS